RRVLFRSRRYEPGLVVHGGRGTDEIAQDLHWLGAGVDVVDPRSDEPLEATNRIRGVLDLVDRPLRHPQRRRVRLDGRPDDLVGMMAVGLRLRVLEVPRTGRLRD